MTEIPSHVAVIPDGNRRYAKLHGISKIEGHRAGAQRMHEVVESLVQLGVKYLTVWGFSTDNWKRAPDEVDSILRLLGLWIDRDIAWLHRNNVRLKHIGRLDELPEYLRDKIFAATTITGENTGTTLNLAFNYSGRAEIVDAVRRLIEAVYDYTTLAEDDFVKTSPFQGYINEELFSRYLYTDGMPDVDLVIRTAGEFRISNFMLWQAAYAEYYFAEALWPDFDGAELEKAIVAYGERRRRFGGD